MKNLLDNKKIIYKQSTFGENEKENEVWNECGTAMCIAGHSRIAGGKLGYDLFKKTSYVLAARLTHLKNTPNTPIFNYMSSDDSEGLDYIEMMASFEQRQDKSIDFNQWLDTLSDD